MAKKTKAYMWSLGVLVAAMSAIACGDGTTIAPTQTSLSTEEWLLTLTMVVQNSDPRSSSLREASVWLRLQEEMGPGSMEIGLDAAEIGRDRCAAAEPCGELSIDGRGHYLAPGTYRVEVKIDRQMGFMNDYLGGVKPSSWSARSTSGRTRAGTFGIKRNTDCHSGEGFSWTIDLD